MANRSSQSIDHKTKTESRVLGRSAATGRYVLAPAPKKGSISIEQANSAVKSVSSKKK